MEATEAIAFLAGSEQRAALVAALYRDGPLGTDALVDRCDAARVTVTRNLEKLRDRGFVVERPEGHGLTRLGELLAEDFLALVDTVETAAELEPVLRRLPPDTVDLDPAALAGATVTVSTDADPYAPARVHAERLSNASEARLLLPAVDPAAMREDEPRFRSGELSVEMVVSPSVAETLRGELSDLVRDVFDAEGLSVYETDREVPFFIGIVDGLVQVGVADEEGIPRALAETDDEAAVSWAEETLDAFRADAVPFEGPP